MTGARGTPSRADLCDAALGAFLALATHFAGPLGGLETRDRTAPLAGLVRAAIRRSRRASPKEAPCPAPSSP